jgi:hypothetical protein
MSGAETGGGLGVESEEGEEASLGSASAEESCEFLP